MRKGLKVREPDKIVLENVIAWIVILILVLLLTACETTGIATSVSDACSGWEPIYVSDDDVLTDDTASQILAHNRFGQSIDCW